MLRLAPGKEGEAPPAAKGRPLFEKLCQPMKLLLVAIGKCRDEPLRMLESRYIHRLKRYIRMNIVELTVRGVAGEERVRKIVAPRDYVIVLDEHGKTYTSDNFARRLEKLLTTCGRVVFIVGDADGVPGGISDLAQEKLSLSTMPFQHDMARVIFLEQLYRAFTIMRGEPYSK